MLRRNLLKSLTAIIPFSFIGKNVAANERNPNYVYKNIVETKSGKPIRIDNSDGFWEEYTYDSKGEELTYRNSNGYWEEYTYDSNGNQLTCKDSDGCWYECTYDLNGSQLTYKDSAGYWSERTYNDKGKILSFKDNKVWIAYTEDSDGNNWEQSRLTYNA